MPQDFDSDHWFILGAGAIGALWAKNLTTKSTLILKDNQRLNQYNKHLEKSSGFILEDNNGVDYFKIDVQSPETLASHIKTNDIKALLVCTKAQQTLDAISAIKNNISQQTIIVLMQNGMGVYEELSHSFPDNIILSATTTHGAFKKKDFHVFHAGLGDTWIGSLEKNVDIKLLQKVADSLASEKFPVTVDNNIEARLWHKLAINCAINPLTVIHQCRNGELLEKKESRQQLRTLCLEIDKVLIEKSLLPPDKSILPEVEAVALKTGNNFSSMYQDALNKRFSEIDYITGFFCQQAQKLNFSVPFNTEVLTNIKNIESKY